MTVYDWLLFLHVAAGFAFVAALVVFWVITIAGRNVEQPHDALRYFRIAKPANALVIFGAMGTLLLGIWLAVDADAYEIWDGWIIAALVLWAIAAFTGQRGGVAYAQAQKLAEQRAAEGRGDEPSPELNALVRDRDALWFNLASSVAVLLILVDMIYKPGA